MTPLAAVRRTWALAVLLVLFVGLATLYNVINPLFESPDELQHVAFVAWIDDHRALPVVTREESGPWEQEGTQPPLYYWLAARLAGWQAHDAADGLAQINPHAGGIGVPLRPDNKNRVVHNPAEERWPYRGTALFVHLLRFVSTLMAAGTVAAVYRLGRLVFPDRVGIALGMAGLVAFIPQFLFLSASVNNDNLIILLASWVLVVLVGWLAAPKLPGRWQLGLLGLLLGLAALAKLSGVLLWPLAAGTLIWLAWRGAPPAPEGAQLSGRGQGTLLRAPEGRWRWLILGALVVFGIALSVSGWWFVRNLNLYGDPTGLRIHLEMMGPRPDLPTTLDALLAEFRGFRYSFWALFGWFNVLVPETFYWITDLLTAVGLAGFGLFLLRSWRRRPMWTRAALVLLFAWLVLVFAGLVRWTLMTPASQGRLLFPALGTLSLFLVAGWAEWLPRLLHRPALVGGLAAWGAWAALCPALIIAPVYAEPARFHSLAELDVVPSILNVRYGECCELVGYVQPDFPIHPGDRVPLTLIWRARQTTEKDYSVFVHANSPDGTIQGQVDTYPAGGRYPTSHWRPGEIIYDTVYIPMSPEARGPSLVLFNVGLYDFSTREELPAFAADGAPIAYVFAGEAALEPLEWPVAEPEMRTDTLLGQEVRLVGVDLSQDVAEPGEVVTATLHWQALTRIRDDYVGFVHLVLPATDAVVQDDHPPLNGDYPTRLWYRGTRIADPYRLELPKNIAPGVYQLWGGLYRPESNARLQAVSWQTGERWKDDLVYVGTLTVVAPGHSTRSDESTADTKEYRGEQ